MLAKDYGAVIAPETFDHELAAQQERIRVLAVLFSNAATDRSAWRQQRCW